MIRFLSLASGSSGNCYFFTDGAVAFMIDAGVGPRIAQKRLAPYGLTLNDLDFILITHDHIDHIKALGIISSKFSKPIYTTEKLKGALMNHSCTRGKVGGNIKVINTLEETEICGVKVVPFPVPHDATETVGYYIEFGGKKIVIVTDCASVTSEVIEFSEKADVLIFEANYDEEMLANGPYPQLLKIRIANGGSGHLSNTQSAAALKEIYCGRKGELSHVFLCHLSDNNNTQQIAYETVNKALAEVGAEGVRLECLKRGRPSELYEL